MSHSVFIKHLLDIELNSREQIQLRSLIKEFTNYEKELKILLQRNPHAVAAAITNQITELQKRMLKDISELDEFCLGELDVVYFHSTIKTMINTFKNTKFFIDSLERILGDKIGQDTLRLDVSCLKEENTVLCGILPILRQFGVSSLENQEHFRKYIAEVGDALHNAERKLKMLLVDNQHDVERNVRICIKKYLPLVKDLNKYKLKVSLAEELSSINLDIINSARLKLDNIDNSKAEVLNRFVVLRDQLNSFSINHRDLVIAEIKKHMKVK